MKNKKWILCAAGGMTAILMALGVGRLSHKNTDTKTEYQEVYDKIQTYYKKTESEIAVLVEDAARADRGISNDQYSETNVRTTGVGEADIVKTDGQYLYARRDSAAEIVIMDTTQEQLESIATIHMKDMQIAEFYISDNTLFVMGNALQEEGEKFYQYAFMTAYDITDKKEPKEIGNIRQSGLYATSRFVDGYMYLFSDFSALYDGGKCEPLECIPKVNDQFIEEDDIYLPVTDGGMKYKVISSIKMDEPSQIKDQKAVMSELGESYVSNDNIYIYENLRKSLFLRADTEQKQETVIRRLGYKDGKFLETASGKINGYLNDSFSIDEYEGVLRLVVTKDIESGAETSVYTMNQNLKTIGKIEGLAKGESVYSARMFGNIGYFVTFRQTDPLFSVDFTDPKNPKILGSLKIPGFSEYLHIYDDNHLLGIGMDTDENGVTAGVKISMFDISDPTDVKEVHKTVIEKAYYSDVFAEYRAVLIDQEKNIIGFSTSGEDGEKYHVFGYDEDGFHSRMEEELEGISYQTARGVYVGEKFYIVKGDCVLRL